MLSTSSPGYGKDILTNGHHWLYVQLLVTIGVVYEKSERYEQALAMYKTIMEKYPEYGFVKIRVILGL